MLALAVKRGTFDIVLFAILGDTLDNLALLARFKCVIEALHHVKRVLIVVARLAHCFLNVMSSKKNELAPVIVMSCVSVTP